MPTLILESLPLDLNKFISEFKVAEVVTSPNKIEDAENYNIFLAGSIEMGSAENWQQELIELLSKYKDINILNPRRDVWDATWKQSINNPSFKEQVNWELDGIEIADLVIFYFDPATKSPITMLELGMVLGQGDTDVIIYCPEGFWRKGNIEVLCDRAGKSAYLHYDKEEFLWHVEYYVNEHLIFS